MPEGLEVEIYRRAAARCVGRTIVSVEVDDLQVEAEALRATLPGLTVVDTERHGKLLLIGLSGDGGVHATLGLHFGMTGRLVVDDSSAIERLEYASGRDDPGWNRLAATFDDGGSLRVNDPRRWATFTMMPEPERLGPDFLEIGRAQLADALAGRRRPLKALLLDQNVIAGFGNMCVDEVLWHASLDPRRPAGEVGARGVSRLWRSMRAELPAMLARGGSHTGVLGPQVRAAGGPCPRAACRGRLRRDVVGGRTTVWCPTHQR